MIFSFFVRNFRYIIDALILAAIIVAFVIFDPLKLFNTGINIRNTPVSVQSIRQIGQLITAEYYGEAMASLAESYTESLDPGSINENGQVLFQNLFVSFDSLRKTDKPGWFTFDGIRKNNIEKRLEQHFPWITHSKFYPLLLGHLGELIFVKSQKKYDEKDILWELFDKGKITENGFKIEKTSIISGFSDYVIKKGENDFKQLKKNIVYIGRGWVKAGIDFGKLKPDDIFYNSGNKTLYIKHCEPEILDCDINPWFIPNKVKGFELIKQKGSFDNPFAEAVKVKKACIENLRMQAINSGIIHQARENARESLMNLFSLIMDSQVSQVVFTKNKFEQALNEVLKDSVISNQEAIFINDLTSKSLVKLDTAYYSDYRMQLADLRDFCDKLHSYNYAGSPVNGFSLQMAGYLQNEQIDSIEFEKAFTTLCSVPSSDLAGKKSKIFRLMANYKLSPNSFIDSCINDSMQLNQKIGFQHKLSGFTHIYRDSLYNRALRICTETIRKPENHYSIWFKSEAECDSARIMTAKYVIGHSDVYASDKLVFNRIKNRYTDQKLQQDKVFSYFDERLKLVGH
ncbi:MAG: DUF4230 domain-containing protein [Mariniphaga sp.]